MTDFEHDSKHLSNITNCNRDFAPEYDPQVLSWSRLHQELAILVRLFRGALARRA